jgi:hypothetical protein
MKKNNTSHSSKPAPSIPSNCLGDFRVGIVYVRVSREYLGNEPYRTFAIARSRKGLDSVPVICEEELYMLDAAVSAMHDIIHVCYGTDDISDEMLAEWFADRSVEWLPPTSAQSSTPSVGKEHQ